MNKTDLFKFIIKNKYVVILWLLIGCYMVYFSVFSILRFHHLYAEYFDLGIMHQTVYNTFMAIKTGDFSRILELTNPHGGTAQIKRMAIHNDIILALLAPFYFIYSGPETILIIQTIVLAIGAWAVFKISHQLLKNDLLSLTLSVAYLLYSPMQRANIFEFHAVTFATTCILFMVYFWLKIQLRLSFLFLILALFTKEEVGLSLGMFGMYIAFIELLKIWKKKFQFRSLIYPVGVIVLSWGWALASTYIIIPYFNGGEHFAAGYYSNVRDTFFQSIFSNDTLQYLFQLLGPIALLPIVGPEFIFVASPEFGINLLSSNLQLRSLMFQYSSVIQPWLFIASIYGASRILRFNKKYAPAVISLLVITSSLIFSYLHSPLPYSQEKNMDALLYDHAGEHAIVAKWSKKLSSDKFKVSSTDQAAPYFAGRRYFYIFAETYTLADYVIVSVPNINYTYRNAVTIPAYDKLQKDSRYIKVDQQDGYEVYKRINSEIRGKGL